MRTTQKIALKDIDTAGRVRQDYRDLEDLWISISRKFLHPVTVVKTPGAERPYKLIAGGRRYKAHEFGKAEFIEAFVHDTLEGGEAEAAVLEAEENFQRDDFTWQERVMAVHRVHLTSRIANYSQGKDWTQTATAKALGVSQASVSTLLLLAPYIINKDEEICSAQSAQDAANKLIMRKETELKRVMLASTTANFMTTPLNSALDAAIDKAAPKKAKAEKPKNVVEVDLSSLLEQGIDKDTLFSAPAVGAPTVDLTEKPPTVQIIGPATTDAAWPTVDLSSFLRQGDSTKVLPALPEASFDHILTDPPYGISMSNLTQTGDSSIKFVERTVDEHQVEANLDLLETIMPMLFRVLKPGGFCVLWYDLDHHQTLQNWAVKSGFQVQRWPFIWQKLGSCKNGAPFFNTTKDYEVAMLLRKDGMLPRPVSSSIGSFDSRCDERALAAHPFFKPLPVWKHFMSMFALKGQTVLDPFAGAGSCILAALDYGLRPVGFEYKQDHVDSGQFLLREYFMKVHANKVNFI